MMEMNEKLLRYEIKHLEKKLDTVLNELTLLQKFVKQEFGEKYNKFRLSESQYENCNWKKRNHNTSNKNKHVTRKSTNSTLINNYAEDSGSYEENDDNLHNKWRQRKRQRKNEQFLNSSDSDASSNSEEGIIYGEEITPITNEENEEEMILTNLKNEIENELIFTKTVRGKPILLHDGFSFIREREGKDGKTLWKCSKWNPTSKCAGRCQTNNCQVISHSNNHNHSPNPIEFEIRKITNKIKETASKSESSPTEIVASCCGNVSSEILSHLPEIASLKKTVRRSRNKNRQSTLNFSNLEEQFSEEMQEYPS